MFNRATLIGRVGGDPEIKTFPSGGKLAQFSLATSEKWTDKNSGERKEKTEWHRIVVKSDGLVGVIENYVKKGDLLHIEGKIETREWEDRDGKKNWAREIVLAFDGKMTMLTPRGENGGRDDGERRSSAPSGGGKSTAAEIDDDIPF